MHLTARLSLSLALLRRVLRMIGGKLLRNEAIASGLLYQIMLRNQVEADDFAVKQDGQQDLAVYLADDFPAHLDVFWQVRHSYDCPPRIISVSMQMDRADGSA